MADKPRGSLGWMKDVLGRSIGLEERRNQMHVVLVEGRRAPGANLPPSQSQLRDELRTRLLVHDPATQTVRNLVHVYEALASGDWTVVEALPRSVMAKALSEAEMLDVQDSTPLMKMIIARLRAIGAAADVQAEKDRVEKLALLKEWETPDMPDVPEVSETTFDEYEILERSWIGTVPQVLELPERDQ